MIFRVGAMSLALFFVFSCGEKAKPSPGTDIQFDEKKIPWEFSHNSTRDRNKNRINNKAIKDFYVFKSVSPFQEKVIPQGKFILAVIDQNQLPDFSTETKDSKQIAKEWFEQNVRPILMKSHTYKRMKTSESENSTEYTNEIVPGKVLRVKMYFVTESPYLLYYIFIWHTGPDSPGLAKIEANSMSEVRLKAGESSGGGEI